MAGRCRADLLPDTAIGRRRRSPAHRRVRRARSWPSGSARRCSSTTRRHLRGPLPRGRGRLRRRRRLRVQGLPLPGHGPPRATRRACTSTWPPAASSTWRWRPASPPSASCCTATTSRSPSCARPAPPASAASWSTASTSSTASPPSTRRTAWRPKVLIRVTPGVEAHTHEFVRTGQVDSKFGFGVAVGRRRPRGGPGPGLARPSSSSACTCTSAARCSWPTSSTRRSRWWRRWVRELGLPELSIGGGLGVAYVEGEEAPTITEWGDGHRVGLPRRRHRRHASRPSPAGPSSPRPPSPSTRSAPIKDVPGIRTYVSVDGGMSDNPRPVLYGSGYEAFLPRRRRCRPAPAGDGGGQALRVGRRARARRPGAGRPRRRRRAGHPGHRRLRPLDGLQLQQGAPPGRGVRGRRARPARCVRRETARRPAAPRRPALVRARNVDSGGPAAGQSPLPDGRRDRPRSRIAHRRVRPVRAWACWAAATSARPWSR